MTAGAAILEIEGHRVLKYPAEGAPLGSTASSMEIIGAALSQRVDLVAIPVERWGDEFFQLRNGVAGEVFQKFVTYHLRIAVVGDMAPYCDASRALHDFVVECNRGSAVWFVRSLEELAARLGRITQGEAAQDVTRISGNS